MELDPDPHLTVVNLGLGGPKTYRSYGSGSATLMFGITTFSVFLDIL
jgi:hypothetical protein